MVVWVVGKVGRVGRLMMRMGMGGDEFMLEKFHAIKMLVCSSLSSDLVL